MKISAVISSDIIKREGIFKDKTLFINFLVLAFALVSGTVLYLSFENYLTGEIWEAFTGFSVDFSSKSKIEVFSGLLLSHIPYIILMIVFGTSSVGFIFSSATSFIKTAGLGIITAYLYSCFGLKGLEYSMLVFLPGKFIMLFSILFMMNTCMNNSLYISKLVKGECNKENSSNLFAVKFATAVILFILSSLTDCLLAVSFSSLFSF